jgi:hypothetical protein
VPRLPARGLCGALGGELANRGDYTAMFFQRATLMVTLFLLTRTASAASFEAAEEGRQSDLPVTITVPGMIYWTSGVHGIGFAPGLSGTVRLTRSVGVGLSLRLWPFQSHAEWRPSGYDESYHYRTLAISYLPHFQWYPFVDRFIFFRFGVGVSFISENVGFSTLVLENRFWPVTFFTGIGYDLRIRDHLFITPMFEFIGTEGEISNRADVPWWWTDVGLGITVR